MDSFLLAREADGRSLIEGRTFENALLLGPAIIAPLEHIEMHTCTWEAPNPDALFIEVEEARQLIGVVGLRAVTFTSCTFRNVGVIGPRGTIDFFKAGIMGEDVHIGPR